LIFGEVFYFYQAYDCKNIENLFIIFDIKNKKYKGEQKMESFRLRLIWALVGLLGFSIFGQLLRTFRRMRVAK
jgi:hypothetical protein